MIKQRLTIVTALLAGLLSLLLPDLVYGQGEPFTISVHSLRKHIPPSTGEQGGSYDFRVIVPVNGENYKVHYESNNGKISQDITVENGIFDVKAFQDDFTVKIGPENVHAIAYAGKFDEYSSLQKILKWGDVKWQSMEGAFEGCKELWSSSGNIGKPDLSQVKSCARMFAGITRLRISLADWDVSTITDMSQMFQGCSQFFNSAMANWNVSNVTNMARMFEGCARYNQPIGKWDVSNVENMEGMLEGCTAFNQSLGEWKLRKCKKLGLGHCGMSMENYSKTLKAWAEQDVIPAGLELDATGLVYTSDAKAAREKLITQGGWIIKGDAELGMHFDPAEELMYTGQEKSLNIRFNGINKAPTIITSEHDDIVEVVDQHSLKVRALKVGQTTIKAMLSDPSMPQITATCKITVKQGTESITLSKTETTIKKGETEKITATVLPESLDNRKVEWTTDKAEIATVDPDGTIHAIAPGKAIITATTKALPTKSATCTVTVPAEVESITLSKTETTIKKGETEKITATVLPESLDNREVEWTTDKAEIATVDPDGTIHAIAAGKAIITATTKAMPAKSATCTVTVTEDKVEVESITLSKTETTIKKGETEKITATVLPESLDNREVTWTTDKVEIATVDPDGTIHAIAAGKAIITATTKALPAKSAMCTVTVTEDKVEVESITLSKTETSIKKGESEKITATVLPESLDNREVEWTTDKAEIATVDPDGTIHAIAPGKAIITATTKALPAKSAMCTVTVTEDKVEVESITLSKTETSIKKGETEKITATVLPESLDNREVEWTTDKAEIATVDPDGTIHAIAAGKAIITATTKALPAKSAMCTVTVTEAGVEVESITLSKTETTIKKGETEKITATVLPESLDNREVTWTTDKAEIATVDPDGTIHAIAAGKAIITATTKALPTKSAMCTVTVTEAGVSVTGIEISKTALELTVGDMAELTAHVLPREATMQDIEWMSGDAAIATVDGGHVTALAAGETNIEAISIDGRFTATCKVTVKAKEDGSTNGPGKTKSDIGQSGLDGIVVSPNPFTTTLHVNSPVDLSLYELTDLSGRTLARGQVAGHIFQIDVANLSSGIYLLRLTSTRGEVRNIRLVK